MTCSLLWVRCLFDRFSISDFGSKWPVIFRKYLSGFREGTPNYFSWPNLVKIGRCEVAERSSGLPHKKLGLRGTRLSPHFAQNRPIAPKIPWTLSPIDMSTYVQCNTLGFTWNECRFWHCGLSDYFFIGSKSVTVWTVRYYSGFSRFCQTELRLSHSLVVVPLLPNWIVEYPRAQYLAPCCLC